MNLFPDIEKAYTKDHLSAREAQRLAQYIAFGPIVFQASRLMLKFGILERLRDRDMTLPEIAAAAGLSEYAAKVLVEASLSIGTVLVDTATDKYSLSKTGWFLLNDPATRVNVDFNHDVNYEGFFHLEEALLEGRPAGLKHFGDWPTLYQGLSSLPEQVKKSWFGFDHFYSDHSFDEALEIVFRYHPERIMDPQQLAMMREQTAGKPGADRIDGYAMDMLDPASRFPQDLPVDLIWMSQFLDCFSEEEILGILVRAAQVMGPESRLAIMETFWDRQKYEPASFCLTMTSLYFTAMANGNSKMYHSDDMTRLVERAGLRVEEIHDGLGQGHSIMICKRK